MLARTSVNNLIGGVSQQPAAARQSDQCEDMVNAWPSPVDGLTKRQPTQHVKKLSASINVNWKFHFINRSPTERYLLAFKTGGVSAWDLATGNALVVRDIPGGGFTYLTGTGFVPKDDVESVTIADYTFVVNKKTTTAMDAATTAARANPGEAYLWVRQGNYKTKYGVRIKVGASDQSYTFSTWDGTTALGGSSATPVWPSPTELNSIRTDDIAEQLRLGINNMGIAGLTATRMGASARGSILKITHNTTQFTIVETQDSIGDSVLSVAHLKIPRVAGYLPEYCTDGFRVKVVGDAEIDADDYFVKFVADESGAFGHGHWEEDLDYSQQYKFNPVTMPHQLTRQFDDGAGTITGTPYQAYFDWNRVSWLDKTTGDSTSVPPPSFIGKAISDVSFYKERLVFLSDDRVNMSETGEPFNFWRTTLLTLEDTSPIDVTLNHHPVAILKQAVPYNENLMLKSAAMQFILRGGEILSPRTVQIVPASAFENYENIRPVSAGRSVFFSFKRGSQSGIREFFQLGDSNNYDAIDATVQVPNYIQGQVELMTVSTLEDTLVVKAATGANHLYIYKYLWAGTERILSSWGKWELNSDATIRALGFVENTLYVVCGYDGYDGTYLEKLELASGLVDSGASYITLLDRRISNTDVSSEVYDSMTDRTTITLPYYCTTSQVRVVEKLTGIQFQIVSTPTTNTVVVRGDVTAKNYWVGLNYTMTYEFSHPVVKVATGGQGGRVAISGAVQKAKRLDFEYHDSGLFKVTVKIGARDTYTYEIAGPRPDFSSQVVDQVVLWTDEDHVPVMGRCQEAVVKIINDGPYPSNLTSAQWTIMLNERGTRIP